MVAKVRLMAGLSPLLVAVVMQVAIVWQTAPPTRIASSPVQLRSTAAPISSTMKSPIIATTDPSPFDPCEDIPFDVVQRLGLAFTPPEHEDGLRCRYDAGNYQLAVEAFIWRNYAQSLPPDAIETTINGHRVAQYWVMKPSNWNDRWWVSCMVTFKTSYGVIQQSLFYSRIYSEPNVDCPSTNLQRAQELTPYYVF